MKFSNVTSQTEHVREQIKKSKTFCF